MGIFLFFCIPSYISGVHHFGWDFCVCDEAAKEMVQLAEQGYMRREQPSDPAWQEMLNHATMKVGLLLSQHIGASACMPSEHCVVYYHTGQRGPELSIFM